MRRSDSPKRLLLALLIPLFSLLWAGAGSAQAPKLPVAQLNAGIHVITAEIAASDPARVRGLMFRQSLPANHGMLFIFDNKSIQCMWMRNTPIPLSVAFLADDGTIVNIEDMQPHDERTHCARQPVRFALEMTQGWFAQKGLGPGAKISRLPAPSQ